MWVKLKFFLRDYFLVIINFYDHTSLSFNNGLTGTKSFNNLTE